MTREGREMPPSPESVDTARSTNLRLETVFAQNPDYVNREYTLPCEVEKTPLYLDEVVEGDDALKSFIASHLRTVIPPETVSRMPSSQSRRVKILASPYESGRVLEADEQIDIKGTKYTMTIKGVGCTRFGRETGGENPFMEPIHRQFTSDQAAVLREFPFYERYGVLEKLSAIEELEGWRLLRDRTIDTETILAVYAIKEFSDRNGNLQPVAHFRSRGILRPESEPVLMVKVKKSNLRLLDFIMLDELRKSESIPALVSHGTQEFSHYEKVSSPSAASYVEWLVRKVFKQELPIIFYGLKMGRTTRWQDIGRNISLMGESLDLDTIAIHDDFFQHEGSYFEYVHDQVGGLGGILRQMVDTINHHDPSAKLSFEKFADIIGKELCDAFTKFDFNTVYQKTPMKKYSLSDFIARVKWEIERNFHPIYTGYDEEGLEQYRQRILEKIAKI